MKKHEDEERPFEPERRGTWRAKSHELVVNPSDFYKGLRELVDESKLSEPDEAFEKAKEILEEGGRPNDVMSELNELLDFHGVGAFPEQQLPRPDFLFLEAGDTYAATLAYSYDENKYFVSTFGDIVENAEPEMEKEGWDSWLEGEVRKQLAREIEGQSSLSEAATEKIVEGLDDIESEDLHMKFVGAVSEVGGQVTFESDGSVFVYRQKEAIEALASELIDAVVKVPEQGSFGFNPRMRNPGSMGGLGFIAALRDLTGPVLGTISAAPPSHSGQLFVNFYNIPKRSEARDRAELENNRMMFTVTGFGQGENAAPPSGKVKIEQSVSALPRDCRLRSKSGTPEQIVRYLAEFLNKVSAQVPPKYAHSRAPNARQKFRDFQPGTKVRLSGKFLRSTGQYTGQDAHSTWKVIRVDPKFDWVLVDEEMLPDYLESAYTPEELRKQPDLRWRRIAAANLVIVGQSDSRDS